MYIRVLITRNFSELAEDVPIDIKIEQIPVFVHLIPSSMGGDLTKCELRKMYHAEYITFLHPNGWKQKYHGAYHGLSNSFTMDCLPVCGDNPRA